MEHKDEKGLAGWEIWFVVVVSLAFITLVWRFVPIQTLLKMALVCFCGVWVFAVVAEFSARIPYFIPTAHGGKLVVIVCVVFLLFPFLINAMYESSKHVYLSSIKPDTTIGLKISYDIDRTGGSGSIGSDWSYRHYFNDIQFGSGDIMEIKASEPFTIRSRFIESDKISDIGETSSNAVVYNKENPQNGEIVITNDVFVMESGGRRYAGSYAEFTATYHAKLTIPPSMNFWEVYFHTPDNLARWIIVMGQLSCLCIIAYVIIEGAHRKEKIKEQERIALEKKKQEERELFIKSLGGKTIREVAGVPSHISYESGFPKDNNNQRYGSFTAYTTKSGSCYHRTPGCCSARLPVHLFVATKKYRPCSKCCVSTSTIPEWHNKYIELTKKCKEYSVEYE